MSKREKKKLRRGRGKKLKPSRYRKKKGWRGRVNE
jgi:hypothetical protein